MIYEVRHTTTYTYSGTVSICHNKVCLKPRDRAQQVCPSHDIVVLPEPGFCMSLSSLGNTVTFFAIQEPHRALTVIARSTVEVTAPAVPDRDHTPAWDTVRDMLLHDRSATGLEAYQYLFESPQTPCSPRLRHASHRPPGRHCSTRCSIWPVASTPTSPMTRATSVSTPLPHVLRARRGSAGFLPMWSRLSAALGLAARYISGAISSPTRQQASPGWLGQTPHTPGYPCTVRATAGSIRIPRTMCCPQIGISPWPGVGITAMSVPSRACSSAGVCRRSQVGWMWCQWLLFCYRSRHRGGGYFANDTATRQTMPKMAIRAHILGDLQDTVSCSSGEERQHNPYVQCASLHAFLRAMGY